MAETGATMKKRVLFVTENVTLAQVVRLRVLADALDPDDYDVTFACSSFDPLIFGDARFSMKALYTAPSDKLWKRMERGQRLYETSTLARYVKAELALIAEVKPDLIIGDLRLSLTVSAPVSRVPYVALINAYWSPFAIRNGFPLPDHPIVALLGEKLAAEYFPKALPFVFNYFARPVNVLRRRHGLPPIGSMPEVLTFGDYTIYPDVPSLTPTRPLPTQHRFLGAVLWSPPTPLPSWWDELDDKQPCVYVTLGSSGKQSALPAVLQGLADLPVQVLLSTAGHPTPRTIPSNVHVANYLPGEKAARRAALVICNGGSSTGYQALNEGTPVLGIASNLDQYLAMTAIENAGAGVLLRAATLKPEAMREATLMMLSSPTHKQAAQRIAEDFQAHDAMQTFRELVREATHTGVRT